ncbi:MAG: cupin domain-containing protein [Anaerolineaceae bacterium]|nr:cupin domain-containing protein [Anaerolineaceae bacterium]
MKMNPRKHTFPGKSGYAIGPGTPNMRQDLFAIGHTDSLAPWCDPVVHLHAGSDEYFILRGGMLKFYIADQMISLNPNEIIMIKANVPHAIVGGEGSISHIGIRAPSLKDKHITGNIPERFAFFSNDDVRELSCDWGNRIPLEDPKNQNCWLIGFDHARFLSQHIILAYMNYQTTLAANAAIGTRHRPHLHKQSWEYYLVTNGSETLQVAGEFVTVNPGEILEIPPGVCHVLHGCDAPFEAFTIRVPIGPYDKAEC